jgi:hypothetical protein
MAVAAMTPDGKRRRQKVLSLMAEYVELADDLGDISNRAELDNILAAMAKTKAQIDTLLDEQARHNKLN